MYILHVTKTGKLNLKMFENNINIFITIHFLKSLINYLKIEENATKSSLWTIIM